MTISSSERAINKFNASLNNLQLYNYQDTGGLLLLRHFLCDTTNVMSINKNWRGAAPYHIPPEKYWHKTAISIIERAFREKWKYGTIATVVKSTGAHALPTPHPKQHTTALLFAAVTIELVKWVVHHNYPVQKVLNVQMTASKCFDEVINHTRKADDLIYSPIFPSGNNCFQYHLREAFDSASKALTILGEYINLQKKGASITSPPSPSTSTRQPKSTKKSLSNGPKSIKKSPSIPFDNVDHVTGWDCINQRWASAETSSEPCINPKYGLFTWGDYYEMNPEAVPSAKLHRDYAIKIKESASTIEEATEERRVKRRSLCQGASEYATKIKKSRPPLAVLPPTNSQPSNKPSLQITKRKRRQSSRRRDRQVKPRPRHRPSKRDRMSHPTSSTSTQVNDATQPSSTTASSSYNSSVPSTVETVNHVIKSPPSECLPLSIWSAQTTAANITLKLGSIKSSVEPTPTEAAVRIQRCYHNHHSLKEWNYADELAIRAALHETCLSMSQCIKRRRTTTLGYWSSIRLDDEHIRLQRTSIVLQEMLECLDSKFVQYLEGIKRQTFSQFLQDMRKSWDSIYSRDTG